MRPILEFSAQSLTYTPYSQSFNSRTFSDQVLKTLINCPRSTSPAIVRLFCGTEPLPCRLDMLKLRYFWKMVKFPADAITFKIFKYRTERLLAISKGFARDIFNICTKHDAIHLWHGQIAFRFNLPLNPLKHIRRIITSQNLRKDLDIGRAQNCSFTTNFLTNFFLYQKTYHILESFNQAYCFASLEGRKRFIKALLHPSSYDEECPQCKRHHKYICEHLTVTAL